jgi:hypothetical protein
MKVYADLHKCAFQCYMWRDYSLCRVILCSLEFLFTIISNFLFRRILWADLWYKSSDLMTKRTPDQLNFIPEKFLQMIDLLKAKFESAQQPCNCFQSEATPESRPARAFAASSSKYTAFGPACKINGEHNFS